MSIQNKPLCYGCKKEAGVQTDKNGKKVVFKDPDKGFNFTRFKCVNPACHLKGQFMGDKIL